MRRCEWCESSDLMRAYHDQEWGVPLHDDRKHFEFLVLDAFQAGLSWSTILNKRERFRRAFHDFDPQRIARYGARSVRRLLGDVGIVRNRQKFDAFIWEFVEGAPRQHAWKTLRQIPATSKESDRMSRALRELGFRFVGSTICYAYMQAAGLVNDHLVGCFRHGAVARLGRAPLRTG
jgi:DNA-3-methyladenine glycosylase I